METGIELLIKTSNSFDLEVVDEIKGCTTNCGVALKAIVVDLDMYYDLALEMLEKNRDDNNIFIFFCDKMCEKYSSLYSFDRVDLEERSGSALNSFYRIEGIIKAFNTFKDRNEEVNSIVSLLVYNNEITLGNNENHNLNVSLISTSILKNLSAKNKIAMDKNEIRLIGEAAMFHDIGKIYIPKTILLKPAKLTNTEYDIVKKHTILGSQMIENRLDIKKNKLARYCYEVTRWHHERYDGNGYPDKLSMDEIPLSAQVVGLADAYDALISKRPYKNSVSSAVAIRMIENGECGSFSPVLVSALCEILDRLPQKI